MRVNNISLQIQQTSTQHNKTQKVEKNLSRVEEIKRAIENGTYKIDIKSTAKAMAKSLL